MNEQRVHGRVIHKHDTETNWNKATNFIPQQGELIIYDVDSSYAYTRAKIGDGETVVSDLPFLFDRPQKYCLVGGNTNTVDIGWHKFASCIGATVQTVTFAITASNYDKRGIFTVKIANNTETAFWSMRYGFELDDIRVVHRGNYNVDLYLRKSFNWGKILVQVITERTDITTMYSSVACEAYEPIATCINKDIPVYGDINASQILGGYLRTHPEFPNSVVIPFINNDLAYLSKKGGSCEYYQTTDGDFTQLELTKEMMTPANPNNVFDTTPSYTMFKPSSTDSTVVIDLNLHKKFSYSNRVYIDFGTTNWVAKSVAFYVMNGDTETVFTLKSSVTNLKYTYHTENISHSSIDADGTTIQGFNKLRIVLSDFKESNARIAEIGIVSYNSDGIGEVSISRGGCSGIYGDLLPFKDSDINLGSQTKAWKEIYAKKIY